MKRLAVCACVLFIAAISGGFWHGGPGALQTFKGKNWNDVLKQVPCNLVSMDGQGYKVNAILIVGSEPPLKQPVLTKENQVKQLEKQCP
jgi:hypothetical protein